jgi:hypothetical protein
LKTELKNISVTYDCKDSEKAAAILRKELLARSVLLSIIKNDKHSFSISFCEDTDLKKDEFAVRLCDTSLLFYAQGIRGFIYGIGLFLRKSIYEYGRTFLIKDISGVYSPKKRIRGHQMGYRPLSNTYDAWSIDDYKKEYLNIMYFGANAVEHIPAEYDRQNDKNEIMKYTPNELLKAASEAADDIDLDVSLWIPNKEKDFNTALGYRKKIFEETKRIDAVFVPGADPGNLEAKELLERCSAFKRELMKTHPDAKLWVSAQAPRNIENWGDDFIMEINSGRYNVDGVITGPNHAFTIEDLRQRLDKKYPIRFYPDITHNLRCEHPVHFDRDDWSYSLAAANGRESINPRPNEYKYLHRLNSPYTVGSVTYSEGVNDDVNKAVWCSLEWNADSKIRDIIEDYARLFFYGCDITLLTDAILGLELNWEGSPENNTQIENTLRLLQNAIKPNNNLYYNWRFLSLLIRAETDAYVRRRVIFENALLSDAEGFIKRGKMKDAEQILSTEYPEEITKLRSDIDRHAIGLFDSIGIQLGTKTLHADGWERGAILDIIDNPVTNRQWLLDKLNIAKTMTNEAANKFLCESINADKVEPDEFYFSLAKDSLKVLGIKQDGEFYIDTLADCPDRNNGTLPVRLFKLYDHYSFRLKTAGLKSDTDYVLMISYETGSFDDRQCLVITANGTVIFSGKPTDGEVNEYYTENMLPSGFTAIMYTVPADTINNGCLFLELNESYKGIVFGELRITKHGYKED